MRRTKIVDILKKSEAGQDVLVKGWVRTRRDSKQVTFIAINDGSSIKNIQVVVDVDKFEADELKRISTGACVSIIGALVESQGGGQRVEIQASPPIRKLGTTNIVVRIRM